MPRVAAPVEFHSPVPTGLVSPFLVQLVCAGGALLLLVLQLG